MCWLVLIVPFRRLLELGPGADPGSLTGPRCVLESRTSHRSTPVSSAASFGMEADEDLLERLCAHERRAWGAGRAWDAHEVTDPARHPFERHSTADLVVDAVYEGGTANNQGDDPIHKLLFVGNAGGFRALGSPTRRTVKYVILYTSGVDPDWPDELDPRTGTFVYHGDQKTPGRALHDTPRKGNVLLRDMFQDADGGVEGRRLVPPVFLFEKASPGRSVAFKGLLVPGGAAIRPDDRLIAIWKSTRGSAIRTIGAHSQSWTSEPCPELGSAPLLPATAPLRSRPVPGAGGSIPAPTSR